MSFTCAASRNFRPPNFTNGTLRRVSFEPHELGGRAHRDVGPAELVAALEQELPHYGSNLEPSAEA